MRRSPIWLAWAAGLILSVLVYTIGPDLFMFRLVDNLHQIAWRIGEVLTNISLLTLDAIRAIAIGLYATFVVLALAVLRRGGNARAILLWVSILFLIVVGGAERVDASPRWTAALLLVGAAAFAMTSRLRRLSEAR